MSHADAMIGIAMGSAALVVGVRATDFYALGPGQRPKPATKTIPRWFGRLWFIGMGAFLICWSLPGLRGDWHWRDLLADWWVFAFIGAAWAATRFFSLFSATVGEESSEHQFQLLGLYRSEDENSTVE